MFIFTTKKVHSRELLFETEKGKIICSWPGTTVLRSTVSSSQPLVPESRNREFKIRRLRTTTTVKHALRMIKTT